MQVWLRHGLVFIFFTVFLLNVYSNDLWIIILFSRIDYPWVTLSEIEDNVGGPDVPCEHIYYSRRDTIVNIVFRLAAMRTYIFYY